MEKERWKKERNRMLKLSNDEAHELTIECIEEALLHLLEEKKFDTITVTDITRKAGVSRTAFYKNYETKEEVVEGILSKSFAKLLSDMEKVTENDRAGQRTMLVQMFRSMKEQPVIELIQTGADGSIALLKYTNIMTEKYLPALKGNSYYCFYIAGAYHNVIYQWVKGGMKDSPEDMARFIIDIETGDFVHTHES